MRYLISVLIRPEGDSEAGDVSGERWFTGLAEVQENAAPDGITFPGEGITVLFPVGADDVLADPDAEAGQAAMDEAHAAAIAETDETPKGKRK